MDQGELRKKIMEIQKDPTLSDKEKATKTQELMSGKWMQKIKDDAEENGTSADALNDGEEGDDLADTLKCAICHHLCVRPITAPCQHNFCLKCFQNLITRAKKKACPVCRLNFDRKFAENPRINTGLTLAIRAFKTGKPTTNKPYVRVDNSDRPDEAYTTDRAKRAGLANAASGRIFVTIPNDHFGPIGADADPENNQGVPVGKWFKDRLHCRQWGAHFPHVAGIAGQSTVGAQSVVLSGGYEDDLDEGEWFMYTGSGGRDLSGNKRTNKVQSFDQKFESMNLALKLSCEKGLPVRVVRSFKEKRSAYAPPPEFPVRYDGLYRIVRCWRKKGAQGMLMCRYLFVRCDNEAAPWSSDDIGDRPIDLDKDLPQPALDEMKEADGGKIFKMKDDPYWDWDDEKEAWGWAKPPPPSQRTGGRMTGSKAARKKVSEHEKALKELQCGLCKGVCTGPVSTPCGHNFCKSCLETKFDGIGDELVPRGVDTGRSMRVRKTVKPCPKCKKDICDFLSTAQINRDMEKMIIKLQQEVEAAKKEEARLAKEEGGEDADQDDDDDGKEVPSDENEDEAGPSGSGSGAATQTITNQQQQQQSAAQKEAVRMADLAHELWLEYPGFDQGLVKELLQQEEGDAMAVKHALSRMHKLMVAEEKKKAKQAKQGATPGKRPREEETNKTEAGSPKGNGSAKKKGKMAKA